MDSFSDEIRSGVRQRKKHTDPTCCPVCGVTVRSHEMEQHYTLEVDRLHKQSYRPRKSQSTKEQQMPSCSSTTGTSKLSPNTEMADGNECWSTYQRIKNNRHARLKVCRPVHTVWNLSLKCIFANCLTFSFLHR